MASPSTYALPHHCLSIGDTILIYWDGDRKWYPAEITEARGDHECEILYKDGEREWIRLDQVKFIVRRDWGGSMRERSKRAKKSSAKEEEEEEEESRRIEGVKDMVFDIEDRLPLGGVCTENLKWWMAWHDDVMKVVVKNDIRGLMDATLTLALQIKPNIMTAWWSKHSDSWKKRLKSVRTAQDLIPVVKDLRDNAINWSIARELFSGKVQVVPCRRTNRRTKSTSEEKPSLKNSTVKLEPVSVSCSTEACRRSNRLKKLTSEGKSSLKNSTLKLESEGDWVVQSVSCSSASEASEDLASVHSPPNKSNGRKGSDRVNFKDDDSADNGVAPQSTTNEPLDELSSADSNTACTYQPTDEFLCSVCQSGLGRNFLVQCKNSGCFCAFHTFCLRPPLQTTEQDWLCPICDEDSSSTKLVKDKKKIAKRIHKIVGRRKVTPEDQKHISEDQFLIKWESLSHHHDSWVPREWLYIIDPLRLHSYLRKRPITSGADLIDERKPEWFMIDRVVACRRKSNSDKSCEILNVCTGSQDNGEFEFLVKWKGLDYSDATWESSCTEELLAEVGTLIKRHQRAAERFHNSFIPLGSEPDIKTPNELYSSSLYDYQLQGLNWILSNFKARKNVILADEMGLGKTVQVVSFIQCMKQEMLNIYPVLVIAPKSILFQWEKEFHHWAKDLNVIIYQGEKNSRCCIRTHEMYSSGKSVLFDALVTNYELVILDNSILKKFKWSAIIIDEAHKIKRLDCKLAKYLKIYTSDFRLLLTGTPLQNSLLELFSLLHFIDPVRFSDPEAEAEEYSCIKKLNQLEIEKKVAEIHELLKPRMLRRMKSDVLPGSIPVKKWVEVPCSLTDSQRELYINILGKNHEKLNEQILNGRKIILNFILMELRKCCNHPYLFPGQEPLHSSKEAIFSSLVSSSGKLQLLEKLLPRLKERGNRVLLFSQMTKMLDILEDFLITLGLSYFRMDGSTPVTLRQQQMRDFNNPDSEVFVFLISTRAGGLGIDLPTADRVIIYDPDFNPFMDLQAQSRAHRIGQTRPVVVYQLITKCSVEEKILHKSKEKLAIENLVMNHTKKPSVDELHSVLLHGARTILNRKQLNATLINYDDKAIEDLLKLDPTPDEACSPENNGYLGSIQSFLSENKENEGLTASPKAKEWEVILGPVQSKAKDLGRGRRQKKVVDYACEEGSDSDEVYSPDDSSETDSSSDSDSNGEFPSPDRDEL